MSVAPSPVPRGAAVRRWVRDSFLLERAEGQVRALAPDRQALVRKYYDAGTRRSLVADDLTDDAGLVSAFVLYRDAAALLGAAVMTSIDPGATADPSQPEAVWDALGALAADGRLPALPAGLLEARQLLKPGPALALDGVPAETLRNDHATVKNALRWLRARVEPRSVREIRVNRGVRVGLAGLVVVVLLVSAVRAIVSPTNIALHKTVTLSERNPLSVAPPDNSGLVNGEIEPNYGVHTTGNAAWVMVDLGQVQPLGEVVVHNRADGWFDDGLPLSLELSENGVSFAEVARRTTHFTASDPWVAETNGRRARYVRIRSPKYIALTEVEVYKAK